MVSNNTLIDPRKNLHADIGENVGFEIGSQMVKDYYDQYKENTYQFIGKNILLDVISQPGCIGINIIKALNENGEKTYVIVGVNDDGTPILKFPAVNIQGELKFQDGIIADRNVEVPGWLDFLK